MMTRYLVHVANVGAYTPKDRRFLMSQLRSLGVRLVNVRVASNHIEVDAYAENASDLVNTVSRFLGGVIEVVNLDAGVDFSDPFGAYVSLFNCERFWEAHEVLEEVWRVSRDLDTQGLIVAAAAFVKLQEDMPGSFLRLAQRALSMIKADKVGCIDAVEFRLRLTESLRTLRPFKAKCLNG